MSPRIAANPIPYWWRNGIVDKSQPIFDTAFADFQKIGFKAVKADVPDGMRADEYLAWIRSYGLEPSFSLFDTSFDQLGGLGDELERAKRFAEIQAQMGLKVAMVCAFSAEERRAKPAIGAAFDRGRLETVIENIATVCKVISAAGLRPVLHPHVGGWVETEEEIRAVLDDLGPDVIGFGPDTGHIRWAGGDPAQLIADYADRVEAIHIKDVFPDFIDGSRERTDKTYDELEATGRLWAEPGLGVVDFDAVVTAMPADYMNDYMIEVDVPSSGDPVESHRVSFEWAKSVLPAT